MGPRCTVAGGFGGLGGDAVACVVLIAMGSPRRQSCGPDLGSPAELW